MLRWFAPPRMTRIVDDGAVRCPVRQREVAVDGCLDCSFLADVVPDDHGGLDEIVCEPAYRALIGTDVA